MTNKELLKEKMSGLNFVEEHEKLSKDELMEAFCGEVLDLLAMQERVSVFMERCTTMSYTTYEPEVLHKLIDEFEDSLNSEFCKTILIDSDGDKDELYQIVLECANKHP